LARFSQPRSAKKRIQQMDAHSKWQWHLDEVFVKINGETHCLWRAVGHEGEVLETFATKRRDRKAALKFLKKSMKRYGPPHIMVTDKLRSYGVAMKVIGNANKQETGRWQNNRSENSHQPFRRRERAMQGFRSMGSLQKFVAVHLKIRKILVIVRGHSNASRSWFGAASGSHCLRTLSFWVK
jgi:putative transposase